MWIGFESEKPTLPIIVEVVKQRNVNAPSQIYNFKLVQRVRNEVSGEAKFCLEKERETHISQDEMKHCTRASRNIHQHSLNNIVTY